MGASDAIPGPGSRSGRRFEARKQAILVSAVHAINRSGVRGMTLGQVAASLDLVPTAVIYYFKNKEELAAACFLRGIERFGALTAAAAEHATSKARVAAFLGGFVEIKRAEAIGEAEPLVVFNDVRAVNATAVNGAYTDMFRDVRSLFGVDGGLTRLERNARTHLLLSEAFWSVVWLPKLDPEDYGRAAHRMGDIAVEGLAAPGQRWEPKPIPPLAPHAGATDEISRANFLRVATELINEQGYVGASVEKISARLKVTKGAFYHHNENKADLVVACFEHTLQVMRAALRAAETVADNGFQRLATAATALVEHQLSGNAPLLRTSALTSVPEGVQRELIGRFDRVSERFAALISDGIADGSIRPVDAAIGAQMLTGMINAAAELQFWAPGSTSSTAASLYVQPLFQGLLSPGAGEAGGASARQTAG
ncbi:MAG TPA: TetR/AcrR family transcriptional regulator [Phenylobacterium sp.]